MFEDVRLRAAPVSALVLLGLGLVAFRTVSAQAPALREDLQVEAITGSERLRQTAAMYDAGSYFFQVGYGYLNADALSFAGLEAPDEVAPVETALARVATAEGLFAESLRRDPANAHAWLAYARTLSTRGAFEEAERALVTSHELGPTTWRLAYDRIFLIDTLRTLTGEEGALNDIRASDLAVLRTHEPRLARVVEES